MTSKERELISDLKKCNFKEMAVYFKEKSEERKNMSKEEKLVFRIINLLDKIVCFFVFTVICVGG